ncbi:MAG: FAD-binding oxidoreductase [Proteobacteria bacterium]|nr:FAD-binding oxidoreductase [Pseudomonadota bacterium]
MLLREGQSAIRALLGPDGWTCDAARIEPRLWDHRRRFHGATALLAMPANCEQVADLLRLCSQHRIGVVPQGGNTSYCGGATPSADGSQLLLSLHRMNRIRHLDRDGFNLIAEAGCTLQQVQEAAESVQRLFPLSLGSEGSCQIGGNLSTNAGGTAVLRYGTLRELVLGVEAVLPDGRVVEQLRSLRKDNTGYDVKQWFIGAEGTLGVITAACLKLFPRPFGHVTAFIGIDDLERCVRLLSALRDALGDAVVGFEVMPRAAVELALRHIPGITDPLDAAHPWYVLAEVSLRSAEDNAAAEFSSSLQGWLESGLVRDAVLASSESQRLALWRLRENIPAAQSREGASIKHDVSLPIAAIPEFVRTAGAAVLARLPGARLIAYGHLGDGNLHFNFSQPPDGNAAAFAAHTQSITRLVHDLVAERGGSFSAEHGVGQSKVEDLRRYEDPVALELMRRLKSALDPLGIMNPGKVL